MAELQIGALANYDARELAERAAGRIMALAEPHAVCIDPRGRVTVEPYEQAVFEDVVGVYSREPGLIQTYKAVRDDLVAAIAERGIVGTRAYGGAAVLRTTKRAA